MTEYLLVLAVTAVFLILLSIVFTVVSHPRRALLTAEKVLGLFQRWILSHKTNSALFATVLLISSTVAYRELNRQIDQALSMQQSNMENVYDLGVVFPLDGGHAHLSGGPIDATFARMDSLNNSLLLQSVRSLESSRVSSDEANLAQEGFLAGDSNAVARANMDEARRRVQIAKVIYDWDQEDLNSIEDSLLGLTDCCGAPIRPTIAQYLLWEFGLGQQLFRYPPTNH